MALQTPERVAVTNDPQPAGLKRVVAAGAMNNLVFAAFGSVLTYLQNLIAMRLLGPEQIGLFAMAAAVAITLEWVSDFGIGDQLIQEDDSEFQTKFNTAATVYLILAVVLAGITVAIAPLMARLYHQPSLSPLLRGMSYAAFTGFLRLPLSLLIRDLKYVQQRVLLLLGRMVSFVLTVALAVKGAGVWALVIGGCAGLIATGIPAWTLCPIRPKWRISRELLKPLFKFSSAVWVAKVSYVLVQQGGMLVLSAFLAIDDVGRFKASEQVAYVIFYVETVLAQTMFPVFCRLKSSDSMLRSAFSKASRISMVWIAAASMGLILFAPDIVRYVLTERWHGVEFFLRAQGCALFLGATISGWESLLKARNRTRVILLMSIFFAICFAIVFVPAVALGGRVGAAWGLVAIGGIILATRALVLGQLGLGISVLSIAWRASAAAGIAAFSVIALTGQTASPTIAIAAGRIALYSLVYTCALTYLELNLLREIVVLVLPEKRARQAVQHG